MIEGRYPFNDLPHFNDFCRLSASAHQSKELLEDTITVVFRPGRIGVGGNPSTGVVTEVEEDTQAEHLGVTIGMRFLAINDKAFTADLLDEKVAGSENYKVTFLKKVHDFLRFHHSVSPEAQDLVRKL